LIPHLCRNIPAGSIHLGTYELVRQGFAKRDGVKPSEIKSWQNLVAGGIGGFLYPYTIIILLIEDQILVYILSSGCSEEFPSSR
jgi:hypothetical protein